MRTLNDLLGLIRTQILVYVDDHYFCHCFGFVLVWDWIDARPFSINKFKLRKHCEIVIRSLIIKRNKTT